MPRPPRLDDAAWLRARYVERGLSSYAIAAALGCDPATVRLALRRHGMPVKPPGSRTPPIPEGARFGRLVVLREVPPRERRNPELRAYLCGVRSCGCLKREASLELARRNREAARPSARLEGHRLDGSPKWRVRYMQAGRKRSRSFRSREEAEAFMALRIPASASPP